MSRRNPCQAAETGADKAIKNREAMQKLSRTGSIRTRCPSTSINPKNRRQGYGLCGKHLRYHLGGR